MVSPTARRTSTELLLLGALYAGLAVAAVNSFSGGLERVGAGSLSIRLADRLIIDAMLPIKQGLDAGAIVATYKMGDQVLIW